jgi:tetratricopeptide (TPR) repeat protein
MTGLSDELYRRAGKARAENRPDDARRDLIDAVALCRETGEALDLAKALTGLGQIERDLHNNDAAIRNYEEAVDIYRANADVLKLAHCIRHLGDIYRNQKRADLAEPCYREALDLYRGEDKTPPLDLANAIRGFAILKHDAGETEKARTLWQEARELYAAVGIKEGVAESSRRLALLAGER